MNALGWIIVGGLQPNPVQGAIYYPQCALAARHLARFDSWLGRRSNFGAAFLALSAVKTAGQGK